MSRPSASKRGYDADWRKLRAAYVAEHPLCEPCLRAGRTTPVDVVHHKRPHRGDDSLRLDWDNLEARCHTCHSGDAQAHEKGGRPETYRGASADGTPLDPSHPWNRGRA